MGRQQAQLSTLQYTRISRRRDVVTPSFGNCKMKCYKRLVKISQRTHGSRFVCSPSCRTVHIDCCFHQLRNITQTSVTLEWPPIKLATANLRSLDIYRNNQRLAAIPSPHTNTS